mmetsp:Transcript_37880/g.77760  ORF Transcript_37880/g.77760 Transcript_37880/m.77760 type:complete len:83 (-) Transcript_37880:413-661(-)
MRPGGITITECSDAASTALEQERGRACRHTGPGCVSNHSVDLERDNFGRLFQQNSSLTTALQRLLHSTKTTSQMCLMMKTTA